MLKPCLFIFLFAMLTNRLYAQRDTIVTFYNSNGEMVKTRDSAEYYRLVMSPDTAVSKDLLVVKEFYKNGKLRYMTSATNARGNFIQGPWLEYYKNGNKKRRCYYNNNLIAGICIDYYPNGKLYSIRSFFHDSIKYAECRDSTGTVLAQAGNGVWREYNDDFKHIPVEGMIKDSLQTEEWRNSSGDSVHVVMNYKAGRLISGKTTLKSGQVYNFNQVVSPAVYSKNGMEGFYQYLTDHLHYNEDAKSNHITGQVSLQYVVEKNGTITNIKVVRKLGYGLDEEAVRQLKYSGKWIPGMKYGIPVQSQYTIDIPFRENR